MPKLDFAQRWILANQYRILAKLDPTEEEQHLLSAEILERGYEDHYREAAQHNMDESPLDPSVAAEVRDILSMFQQLQWAAETIDDPAIRDSPRFKFWGFDANNNLDHLRYARFLHDLGEYEELGNLPTLNSHSDTIGTYRLMVDAWKSLPPERRGIQMGKAEVQAILDAPGLESAPSPTPDTDFQA